MGIDYNSSFATNIQLTKGMVAYAISKGYLDKDFWNDPEGYFNIDNVGLVADGSYYSGEIYYYLDIPTTNIIEMNNQLEHFCQTINKYFDTIISPEDIGILGTMVIS